MNLSDPQKSPPLGSVIAHPLLWLLLLAAAHVAVRLAISPALKWDEAEQILWSQNLALGYGAQPPLYTWLQWAFNSVFGPSVLALSALKHSALVLTYVLMWGAGRELLGPRGAWWASASMLLLPPLGWYSVRDQTHSILVTAMACAAWWMLFRLIKRPSQRDFALLGLACGIGMLSKYSFALVAGAMVLAALMVPEARRALLSRGWWWTPIVAALVFLPHASWLMTHLQEATAGTLHKMQIQADPSLTKGLFSLFTSLLGVLLLWSVVALWAFRTSWWRKSVSAASVTPWALPLFRRYLMLVTLALVGMVLLGGVTTFRERWLLPLLCVVPLMAFAVRPDLQQHPRAGRYTAAVTVIAVLLLVAAGARLWFGLIRGDADELNHPVLELAGTLRDAGYDGRSPIVAADHMLAGTLRTRFPQAPARACTADDGQDVAACVAASAERARLAGQGLLLISRSDRVEPDWWARAQSGLGPMAVLGIDLPFHQLHKLPPAHYEFAWQPARTTP
ncbi:glycosyltransferase family 39 protein [Ottowia thiooxydans]|uniref:glycosyltransferase family 39 protein n=1 Tax=Ottowia thiooxydans TaxID=219182 RepID=UPI00040C4171|nr:glycosyltransferase family 39 protein [Ottowia thiooxydans]